MEKKDVISALHEEIFIKGVPIEKSKLFMAFSDMNISNDSVSDYKNSLNIWYDEKKDVDAYVKIILTIFRINPIAAVYIIERSPLLEYIDVLAYSIKPLYYAVIDDGFIDSDLVLLNKNKVPYVILLIEAMFQRSIRESGIGSPSMLLEHAQKEDAKLHKEHKKAKYLNAYNIRHILNRIPENCQIEFINWFWDKHCYASRQYGKNETFVGRRVKIMMSEITEGSLWRHLENASEGYLSSDEMKRNEKEKDEIKKFISSVVSEGRHTEYVKIVIGKDNFYEKLRVLMGNDFVSEYDKAVGNQTMMDEQEEKFCKADE